MLERINALKSEIERLRNLAGACDRDIGLKVLELADEMQQVVAEMEKLHAPEKM